MSVIKMYFQKKCQKSKPVIEENSSDEMKIDDDIGSDISDNEIV